MAAVVVDMFGYLVGLSEIDDAAVPVSAVDEVVVDVVLVLLANQIVKYDDFLVVDRHLLARNDFIPRRFDDLVTNLRVNILSKVQLKSLIFVLVEVF